MGFEGAGGLSWSFVAAPPPPPHPTTPVGSCGRAPRALLLGRSSKSSDAGCHDVLICIYDTQRQVLSEIGFKFEVLGALRPRTAPYGYIVT